MTTENELRGGLELTEIAADWDYSASRPPNWPNLPRISSIHFDPAAANDKLVVKDGTEDGPRRCVLGPCDNANDQRIKYFHGARLSPFIDFSECVLTAGHRVTIELWSER
jgi:hypothetical protein